MSWELFTGDGIPHRARSRGGGLDADPAAAPWRQRAAGRAPVFDMPDGLADAVNAALHLRRPLLLSPAARAPASPHWWT